MFTYNLTYRILHKIHINMGYKCVYCCFVVEFFFGFACFVALLPLMLLCCLEIEMISEFDLTRLSAKHLE